MTGGPRVLVVEDNAMNADVLRETLSDAGYESTLAVNGASGVAMANEMLPDIILMDVNLPILDGLSATRLLKNNMSTKGIPVVALTARAMVEDRDVCLSAGCDDYLSKPVDMEVLLAKMRHHLDRRSPAFVDSLRRQRTENEDQNREISDEGLRPGMNLRDYEEEFAVLNASVERAETASRLARAQLSDLEKRLAEKDQDLTAALLERDAARHERDRAQRRVEELESGPRGDGGSTAELRQLTAQHENLRRAFLTLQRTVAKAVEDAMHEVAFGKS